MKCQECPKKGECRKYFQKGSSAGATCKEETDDESKRECARGFRVANCGPVDCEMCDEEDCPDRCAEYLDDDNVDNDGVGDSDVVDDEYGNEGAKLFDVEVVFDRKQSCTVHYKVAADSEEEAIDRADDLAADEPKEELDWNDEDDSPNWCVNRAEEEDE